MTLIGVFRKTKDIPINHLKQEEKYMKKWLLLQLDWKNENKEQNLHNISAKVRKEFDSKEKLNAYVEFLKDARKMGEIPMNVGFAVVPYDGE